MAACSAICQMVFPELNGPDIPLGHKIVVRSVPATGELIGYVEILGIMWIGGIFASAGGPAVKIEHIYAYDLDARAERSSEFSIDPPIFERQDWRRVGLGPTTTDTPALMADLTDKLERVFVRRYSVDLPQPIPPCSWLSRRARFPIESCHMSASSGRFQPVRF